MDLIPYFIMALMSVLIAGSWVRNTYDTPRRLLVSVVGVTALVWSYDGYGVRINLQPGVAWVVVGLMCWWVITTLATKHTHKKMVETGTWLGVVIFTAFGFGELIETGVMVVVCGAVVNCVYAIIQRFLKWEFLKNSMNHKIHAPLGFIGNTNILGSFLLVNLFLSIWLAQTSIWWLAATGLIGFTIYITKCRSAYLGAFTGWLTLYILGDFHPSVERALIIGLYVTAAVVIIYKRKYLFDKTNLIERMRYWQLAWEQIKKTPFFGIGLGGFMPRVPYLQRELNGRTNGKFLDPKTYKVPWPESSHNDYIQVLCETGVIGVVGFLVLIGIALMAPVDAVLKAGLVSVIIAGVFLDNFWRIPANIWTWFLVFVCLRSHGEEAVLPVWTLGLAGVMVVFVWYIFREVMTDYYFMKYSCTKDITALDKAIEYAPDSGHALVYRGAYNIVANPWSALTDTMTGIYNYDGEIQLWNLWSNLGKANLVMGNMPAAEKCAQEALTFYPHDPIASQLLIDVKRILVKGYKVKRTTENTNES